MTVRRVEGVTEREADEEGGRAASTGRSRPPGRALGLALLGLVATMGAPESVVGQGFGIYEQGTCAMGRAGAAVAQPCGDGSGIFFNPAATVEAGNVVTAGATYILTSGAFTPFDGSATSDLDTRGVPVPHLFANYLLSDDLAVGVGLYVPYGLETTWPLSFEGRFAGYDNSLASFYVQPNVAWRVSDRVSVGAGLTVVTGDVEINQREDLATTPVPEAFGVPAGTTFDDLGIRRGTDFADTELSGDAETSVGGHVGIQVELSDRARFGARYLTQVSVDYDGDADFTPVSTGVALQAGNPFGVPAGTPLDAVLEQAGLFTTGGPLTDQGVETSITMPDQFVGGVAVDVSDRVTLFGDVQWTDWADFDAVVLDFESQATPTEVLVEDYETTVDLRFGAEVALDRAWTVRGGYVYNEAAAPDQTVTPLLPEADRNSGTFGVGWHGDHGLSVDAAYMFIGQEDRPGRVREPAGAQPPTVGLNEGVYSFEGHLIGLTLTLAGW